MTDEPDDVVVAEPAAPAVDPAIEQEARELGWKSPTEWKGEIPAGYIQSPQEYLEKAERSLPYRKVKERLAEVEAVARKAETIWARQMERDRAQHAAELASIKAEKAKAFDAGDKEAFDALEQRQEALRTAVEPAPDQGLADIERWATDKPWFGNKSPGFDPIMTNAAAAAWGEASARGMTDPKAILQYVDRRMAEYFPGKLGAKNPDPPKRQSAVEPGLTFGGQGSDDFGKLPKAARDAFQRMVQKGLLQDDKAGREQYVKDYNE